MWENPFRVRGLLLALLAILAIAPLFGQAGAQIPQRPGASVYLTGQLLVASPELQDPNFSKTVVFMVDHGPDGALGIIINREIGAGRIAMLMKGFGLKGADAKGKIMLHFGGPVRPQGAFILHSSDWHTPLSRRIDTEVSFTTDADILRALGAGKGPKHVLFALGYAGWTAGQLENEIESGAWTVAPAGAARVFRHAKDTLWDEMRGNSGIPL
ncbi:MAG: YqgE/AlgH family protein [Hyphomicrobiales bacterium]|nr:YqgE/AlgH family protein [Hyphomicrobiales bacterium]